MDGTAPPEPEGRAGIVGLVRDVLALDRRVLAILVAVPVLLTLIDYYGNPWHYARHKENRGRGGVIQVLNNDGSTDRVSAHRERVMQSPPGRNPPFVRHLGGITFPDEIAGTSIKRVHGYLWWGLACLVCLILLPMLVGAGIGRSPRSLGLKVRGTLSEAPTYVILYLLFIPVIYLVSQRPDFQHTYPFYKPLGGIGLDFWIFEAVYFTQFLGIEFFFRGFIVLGLKPYIGRAAILVMLAPYCMIHFYKPMPEALGAIGAGVLLGTLAYRSGTIIYGWFLHYAVALSMDLLALHHTGVLGGRSGG